MQYLSVRPTFGSLVACPKLISAHPLLAESPHLALDGQPIGLDELSSADDLSERAGYEAVPCKAQTAIS